jgi:hypothetical protein
MDSGIYRLILLLRIHKGKFLAYLRMCIFNKVNVFYGFDLGH